MSKKMWKVTRVVAIEAVVIADRKWQANALFDEELSEGLSASLYAWHPLLPSTHRITEGRWEVVDEGSFGVKEVSK